MGKSGNLLSGSLHGLEAVLDTLNLMQAQLIRQWPDSPLPCLDVEALEPLR